jgi:hypothetical protein
VRVRTAVRFDAQSTQPHASASRSKARAPPRSWRAVPRPPRP